MRVRQLVGGHVGEVVEMPYHIARRALASGMVAEVEPGPRIGLDDVHEHRDRAVVTKMAAATTARRSSGRSRG